MSSFSKLISLSWWKCQSQLIGLALMFFTQIPVSKNLPYSEKRMNQANRYFSLIGLIIGGIVSVVFYVSSQFWSVEIAIVLTLASSALLTGAFHEDGLADMADGMGGGYNKEKRLLIMKDSRLGTYGAITLVFSVLLKFVVLVEISQINIFIFTLVFAYGLSRATAASLIFSMNYVTEEDESKSKPLASKQSFADLLILFFFALLPCVFIGEYIENSAILLVKLFSILVVFRALFKRWLTARIGGFTGDCLGAAQQISELIIYLVILNHVVMLGGTL